MIIEMVTRNLADKDGNVNKLAVRKEWTRIAGKAGIVVEEDEARKEAEVQAALREAASDFGFDLD